MVETEITQVKAEEYNKVVEMHNAMKVEKEKIENELKSMKEQKKETETKQIWEQETQKFQKQIEELNKKLDETQKMASSKANPKGIVQEPPKDNVRDILNREFPEPKIDASRIPSAYGKLRHFKSNVTREFTREQLGRALNIHAVAQKTQPGIINPMARDRSPEDVVFK